MSYEELFNRVGSSLDSELRTIWAQILYLQQQINELKPQFIVTSDLSFEYHTKGNWSTFGNVGLIGPSNVIYPDGVINEPTYVPTDTWRSERYGSQIHSFSLLPQSFYRIELYFAERYPPNYGIGNRLFEVWLNGGYQETIDIFERVGANHALTRHYVTGVGADGILHIELRSQLQEPTLFGYYIEGPEPVDDPLNPYEYGYEGGY